MAGIPKEKMDKMIPLFQGGLIALYMIVAIVRDVLHISGTVKKANKARKKLK